ncbi:hypothetical protein [Streptomyces sp900116325]
MLQGHEIREDGSLLLRRQIVVEVAHVLKPAMVATALTLWYLG